MSESIFSKEEIREILDKKSEVKQVLVWRDNIRNTKGYKVTKGKFAAQMSHSSLGVVLNAMRIIPKGFIFFIAKFLFWIMNLFGYKVLFFAYKKHSPWDKWLNGRFTKVCVYCKDEQELLEIYKKSKDAGIPSVLITDAGLTEFGGVPTNTCVGIGPYWSSEIDKITGKLPLL